MSHLFNCHKGKLFYGKDGIVQNTSNQKHHKHKMICDIIPMKDSYQLNFEANELLNKDGDIWLSLQHSYDIKKGYRIHQGDVIKFGSVIFYVTEIGDDSYNINEALLDLSSIDLVKSQECIENNQLSPYLVLNNNNNTHNANHNHNPPGFKSSCRICLEDKSSSKNPLISPCNCKGTMEFIHLDCLRKMIKMEVLKRSFSVTFYMFTSLICDLCKTRYSKDITYNHQNYSLYAYDKPQGSYIILHHSLKSKETFVAINLEEGKSIAIGKTPLVDIPFPDFSISYVQAMISYSKGHYYLTDLKSKYGTYIKLPKKFNVLPFHTITLQINHYFFSFSMKKTIYAYLTCYFPKNLMFKSYNDYFTYLSTTKNHQGTKYSKTLSHKKIVLKSMMNSRTPNFFLKTGAQLKSFINKANQHCFQSVIVNH